MTEKKQRRRYLRLNAYHLVKYRLISSSRKDESLLLSSIKNIGGGGACLHVEEYLPPLSVVQLHINFPGLSRPVPCLAKVMWIKRIGKSNRYKVGLQFLEIEEALRAEIIKHIGLAISKDIKRKRAK